MPGRRGRLLLAVVTLFCSTAPARADLLAPDVVVGGLTQAQWSARWWQWAVAQPTATNPLTDTTGAFSRLGNQGQVFFLANSLDGVSTRSATVGAGQYLFFPLVNTLQYGNPAVTGAITYPVPESQLRTIASQQIQPASSLFVKLNGQEVPLPTLSGSLLDYRQQSPPGLFDLKLPASNIAGVPGGFYPASAVSDGYWAMLGPLKPGSYTLEFGGTGATGTPNQFSVDSTYHLTVTAPEPSSLALLTSAGLVLCVCAVSNASAKRR